jgi:hypothetical protein
MMRVSISLLAEAEKEAALELAIPKMCSAQ